MIAVLSRGLLVSVFLLRMNGSGLRRGKLLSLQEVILLDEVAWYRGNAGNQTHPVAQKKANGYGLYDMIGNVGEWCADDDLHPGEHLAGAKFRVVRGAGCQI